MDNKQIFNILVSFHNYLIYNFPKLKVQQYKYKDGVLSLPCKG